MNELKTKSISQCQIWTYSKIDGDSGGTYRERFCQSIFGFKQVRGANDDATW